MGHIKLLYSFAMTYILCRWRQSESFSVPDDMGPVRLSSPEYAGVALLRSPKHNAENCSISANRFSHRI